MAGRIQLRRGTAANWTSADPVLASGEVGFETDTGKFKVGDGSTAWSSLGYFQTAAAYQPLDSDLTAIAALSTTTFGRSLLALADAAAGRTSLGLGTMAVETAANYLTTAAAASGYQPLDSDLTAIAALSTTSYGRSLLTSADAAALRTTASAAPLADTTSIWLAPSDFAINAGSPSIATGLLIPSIALDPTSIEIITAGFRTPSSWVTADVTLWYYTASAVGNFVINPRIYLAANGESAAPSAEAGITSSITVAGSTAAIANTQACGTFTCRSNAVGSFWLQRNATSGSDTNAGDFSVLGVAITKAS